MRLISTYVGTYIILALATFILGFVIHIAPTGNIEEDLKLTLFIIIGILLGVLTFFIVPLI